MGNRPAGDPVLWAEADDTYPDGPRAGQLTKVMPSQGFIDRGFYPDRKVPAKWLNAVLNDVTLRAAYLDLVDILNWDAIDTSLTVTCATETFCTWDPKARVWWMVEGTTGLKVYYSADGKAWTEDTTLAGTPAEGESIACEPRSGFVLVCERSTGNAHRKDSTNTWSEHNALMSNMVVHGAVANKYPVTEGFFLVFGQDSSNNRPKMYTVTSVGTPAATKRDLTNEASYNTQIKWVAVAPDRVVCMGTNGRIWYHVGSGDGTWLQAEGGAAVLTNPQGLSYDEVNGVFWCIDNDSSVKTSQDGISWVSPDANTPFSFECNGGCISFNGIWICHGGITIPAAASLAGERTLISTDMGVTWEDSPCPIAWAGIFSEDGRKLLAMATNGDSTRTLRTR